MTGDSVRSGAGQADSRTSDIRVILVRWGAYTVVIPVLPVVVNALVVVTRGQPVSYVDLVAKGELLLVSVAICAAAAGELSAATAGNLAATRSLLIAMSVVTIILAALWFAVVADAAHANDAVDRYAVAVGSTVLFAFATITGACCMAISRLTS